MLTLLQAIAYTDPHDVFCAAKKACGAKGGVSILYKI
jgi:hypothetical protein